MCFLLGLVVLLMQRVSDPRYIERGFKALGVPFELADPDANANQRNRITATATQQASVSSADTAELREKRVFESAVRDLIPRIVDDWTVADLDDFAVEWFRLKRADVKNDSLGAEELPDSNKSTGDRRQQLASRLQEQADSTLSAIRGSIRSEGTSNSEALLWIGALERFERELDQLWVQLESSDSVVEAGFVSPLIVECLVGKVDQRLIQSMSDGTPWRRAEQIAFARLLEMQNDSHDGTSTVGLINTQQLEAESETRKGTSVRFRGSVQRIESVENESSFGVDRYWVIWLRGVDRALQPVVLYTQNPIASELELAWSSEAKPEIEARAIVGKRLAYASAGGVEVAATLFSDSLTRMQATGNSSAADTFVRQPMIDELFWALGLGGLAAFAVLLPVLRRWRKSPVTRAKSVFGSQFGERLRSKKPMVFWLAGALSMSCPFVSNCPVVLGQSQTPIWAKENAVDQQRLRLLAERLDNGIGQADRTDVSNYLRDRSGDFPDGLLKMLDGFSKFGWNRIPGGLTVDLEAAGLRFRRFELKGLVRFASRVGLTESQSAWYQSTNRDRVYLIGVQQEQAADTAGGREAMGMQFVFSGALPQAWLEAARLKQPVQVSGVGVFASRADEVPICVLTESVSWRLGANDLKLGVQPQLPEHWTRLAEAGWDLAWMDRIAENSQQRLAAEEAEGLFSLIRLLKEKRATLQSGEVLPPMQALADSTSSFGKLVRWPVRLVSAAVVSVEDEELAKTLNANRYLQFDGFVDIGNQVVNYQAGDGRVRFEREFPVTVLAAYEEQWIPEDLRGTNTLAWDVGRYYEAEGLYYRLWSYESELVQRQDAGSRQASPLVLASKLSPIMPPNSGSGAGDIGWFGYALCLATLVILGSVLYLATQRDRRRHR